MKSNEPANVRAISTRHRLPERALIRPVLALLRRMGYHQAAEEAHFCGRYMDVFAWRGNNKKAVVRSAVAIELKVAAPSKAFHQAERYLYVAPHAYVAILENGHNATAMRLSEATGVGLIGVRSDCLNRLRARILVRPKRSSKANPVFTCLTWRSVRQRSVDHRRAKQ